MNREKLLDILKKILSQHHKDAKKIPIELEYLYWMLSHSSEKDVDKLIRHKKNRASSIQKDQHYPGISFEKQLPRPKFIKQF